MKLMGFAGFARAGKNSAADGLKGWTSMAFADHLKDDIFYLPPFVSMDWRCLKPEDKEKIRPLLVAYGATARAFLGSYWIDRLFAAKVFRDSESKVVICDCRYENEVREIERRGGRVIRINRPGFGPANSEEERSFAEIDLAFPNLITINNDGTVEDLQETVRGLSL